MLRLTGMLKRDGDLKDMRKGGLHGLLAMCSQQKSSYDEKVHIGQWPITLDTQIDASEYSGVAYFGKTFTLFL